MARSGGSRASRGGRPVKRESAPGRGPAQKRAPAPKRPPAAPADAPAREEPRTFRLGIIPGATPGKWIDAFSDRAPRVTLELVPLSVAEQHGALTDRTVDAAIVRLPLEDDALHVITLYTEVPVVVASADSHLTAADELASADLAGEVLIVPRDDVLSPAVAGALAPAFAAPETTADAIATVAAGVGVVIVPMSLARLHARRDVAHRPLRDGPVSSVALAWPRDADTSDVQTFVGIVRGRTANSSR